MNNNDFTVLNHTLVDYDGAGGDITIPDDVIKIEEEAFLDCKTITSVVIPDSVKTIGSDAFKGCTSLKSAVIGTGLTRLSWGYFEGCTALESVTIPNSITEISHGVFQDCTSLKSITIPKSVDDIGESIFRNCTLLDEINVDAENPVYSSKDGVLFCDDEETIMYYPGGRKGEYTIPDGVIEIGKNAFELCTGVTGIVIPDSVTVINDYAFHGCSSLKSVNIPNGVTEIGRWLFKDCSSLESITIHEDVESIDEAVFMGCKSLKRIDVDEGNPCFCSVDGVLFSADQKTLIYLPTGGRTEYTIPEGVKEIGPYACADCGNVTLTFPKSLKAIGEHGDSWCYEDCNLLDCFSGCKFSKGHLKTKNKINANLADVLIDNGLQPDVLDAVWVYLVQSMKKLRAFTEPKLEENPAESAEMFIKVLISNKFTAKQYDAVDEFFTKFKDLISKEAINEFREMKKSVK